MSRRNLPSTPVCRRANPQPKVADEDLVKCRSTERSSDQVQPRRRRRVKVWVARCRGRSYLESVAVADVVCTFGQRGIWESVPPITSQCHSVLSITAQWLPNCNRTAGANFCPMMSCTVALDRVTHFALFLAKNW